MLQWRLHEPATTTLITGLKRDIELLQRVPSSATDVVVCDIALARNREPLLRLLQAGARVRYFDHHMTGEPLSHPNLLLHVNQAPDVCSSLLVAQATDDLFGLWGVVGAFGDNLVQPAQALGERMGLDAAQLQALRRLGELINYNAYGDSVQDVMLPPEQMFARMVGNVDPLTMALSDRLVDRLDEQRHADLAAAEGAVRWSSQQAAVYELPDGAAGRRIAGTLANTLARRDRQRAVAVMLPVPGEGAAQRRWRVSVRAPLDAPAGAGALCERFGGSGRAGAGGVDALPDDRVDAFLADFAVCTWGRL